MSADECRTPDEAWAAHHYRAPSAYNRPTAHDWSAPYDRPTAHDRPAAYGRPSRSHASARHHAPGRRPLHQLNPVERRTNTIRRGHHRRRIAADRYGKAETEREQRCDCSLHQPDLLLVRHCPRQTRLMMFGTPDRELQKRHFPAECNVNEAGRHKTGLPRVQEKGFQHVGRGPKSSLRRCRR
jgi:hypothetical protein